MLKKLSKTLLAAGLVFIAVNASAYNSDSEEQQGSRKGPPKFSMLDIDGDSMVTLDEFKQHQIPRGDHETVFNHIDSDGDGFISANELSSHKPPRR